MIRLFLLVCVYKAQGQYAPLIFAAPSAVSHQSRIDIRHSPEFVSAPLVYSPLAVYPSAAEAASDSFLTPVIKADQLFIPVALTFFHNLPLARALEHPISIDKIREEVNAAQNPNTVGIVDDAKENEEENSELAVVTDENDDTGRNYDTVLIQEESKST